MEVICEEATAGDVDSCKVLLRLVGSAEKASLQQGSLSAKMWNEWMWKMKTRVVSLLSRCLKKIGNQENVKSSWSCVRRSLPVLAACLPTSRSSIHRRATEEKEEEEEEEESVVVLATQVISMGMNRLAITDDQDCWRAINEAARLLVSDAKQQVKIPSTPSLLSLIHISEPTRPY
eukprot:758621-Hanusia_phi.AAC.1